MEQFCPHFTIVSQVFVDCLSRLGPNSIFSGVITGAQFVKKGEFAGFLNSKVVGGSICEMAINFDGIGKISDLINGFLTTHR